MDRLRLEAEVRLRAQKEQERLNETRNRIAEAHKEIGELRFRADEEERHLAELKGVLADAEKASQERSKLAESLAAQIETPKASRKPRSAKAGTGNAGNGNNGAVSGARVS
jgi:hypothetical protein